MRSPRNSASSGVPSGAAPGSKRSASSQKAPGSSWSRAPRHAMSSNVCRRTSKRAVGCASSCSAGPGPLLTRVLGSPLGGSCTVVPSTATRRNLPSKGTLCHSARNSACSLGITSARSLERRWQKAEHVGAEPSQPNASASSADIVSSPQVTRVQSSRSSGIFLLLVKSRPGDLAHSSGFDATPATARRSLRRASSDALVLAISHLLASETGTARAAPPISAREARKTFFDLRGPTFRRTVPERPRAESSTGVRTRLRREVI